MERAIWQNNEYYASEIMEDFDLETTIRNVSSRELFCPDPCCKKPLLKYCHGDIKDAYFAHLENDDCDYGNFDGRTSLNVKKVRRVLFEYFKALGYDVSLEQKLLPHHYTHILLRIGSRQVAVEIGTQSSIAKDIIDLGRQYKEKNIAVKWIVLSKNDEHKKETQLSYLKRYCLNTSSNNDVLIVDEEGIHFTQIRLDKNDYSYYHYYINLGDYGDLYLERGMLNNLIVENCELSLFGFNERYNSWVANKKALFDRKVSAIKAREERYKTTYYKPTPKSEPVQKSLFDLPMYEDKPIKVVEETPIPIPVDENNEDFVWYTREDLELGLSQQDKQVYDTHGDRWVRCSKCGKADRTDAFFEYGGQDTKNIGICSECQRKSREKR